MGKEIDIGQEQTKILDYIFTELEWMDLNTDLEEEPRPRLLRWTRIHLSVYLPVRKIIRWAASFNMANSR